jgi:hypothetical protein
VRDGPPRERRRERLAEEKNAFDKETKNRTKNHRKPLEGPTTVPTATGDGAITRDPSARAALFAACRPQQHTSRASTAAVIPKRRTERSAAFSTNEGEVRARRRKRERAHRDDVRA